MWGIIGLGLITALTAYVIVVAGQFVTWAHWEFATWRARRLKDELGARPKWMLSAGGAAAAVVFYFGGGGGHSVALTLLAVMLAVVVATDVRVRRIYDVNIAIAGASIALVSIADKQWIEAGIGGALAIVTYVFIGAALRVVSGRQVFADGDYKLGAVIGLTLGPIGGPMAIALAMACGAAIAIARPRTRGKEVAFAPYLTSGAVLAGAAVRLPVFGG